MAAAPGSGSSNPRKFSEKIALHNQKQAEETRAFDELMTDLTVSRVQFQKLQQLRLAQSRAQYYGGSLPNVNQIGSNAAEFQASLHAMDNIRGMRHHGLVERVTRNRLHSPHHRPMEKHGRQISKEGSPYAPVYLSPPSDSWRRQQPPWSEEKRPGFRLLSALNRTNSDSALHTSALSNKSQDPFVGANHLSRPPQQNAGLHDGEIDNHGEAFTFPGPLNEGGMLNMTKPLPKQLWEAKKVQSLSSRPRSCEVPNITGFPSSEQNAGLSLLQGTLNTGGSLPDLTNLHFPSPLPTPLDPDDAVYPSISGEATTSNLPAAMTHLGISSSSGLQSTCSNASIQAAMNNATVSSPVNSHAQPPSRRNPALHPALRLSSLSNPSLPTTALSGSPRRRHTPVSPLTLTPGSEPQRGVSRQYSPTSPQGLPPNSQFVALDRSPLTLPLEPPPYALYQEPSQPSLQHQEPCASPGHQQQPSPPVPRPGFHLNAVNSPFAPGFFTDLFLDQQQSIRQGKVFPPQQEQYDTFGTPSSSLPSSSGFFDPSMNLQYSQTAMMGLGGSHGNLQEQFQLRPNYLYSNYGGSVPNIILTDESSPSLSKDISTALAGVSEMAFDADNSFQLDDELKIEPLTLDGLSMLSDPDMVLPDPSIEDTFRSDKL